MDFKIHPFEQTYRHFPLKRGVLLEGANGAWSEISPLPGRSIETLSMAIDQLEAIQQGFAGPYLPSVAFGLYGLTAPYTASVPCALFLAGPPDAVLKTAEEPHGCTHAKVKVGSWSLEEAIDVLRILTARFTVRIDFNLAWKQDAVHRLCAHLPLDKVEFLEDPGCPVHPFPVFSDAEGLSPTVWKPMVRGLPTKRAPLILSSSFETSIGLHHIASLIQSHLIPLHALGIGTLHQERDVVQNGAYLENGRIHFPKEMFSF